MVFNMIALYPFQKRCLESLKKRGETIRIAWTILAKKVLAHLAKRRNVGYDNDQKRTLASRLHLLQPQAAKKSRW